MIKRLLTIVIPTRNRFDLLELCLQSVFQRQHDLPKVFVSDNSTQQLRQMEELRRHYPFSYVRQSGTLSMVEHHNACLRLPETPWALLLHDDDELYPDALSKLGNFLEKPVDVGVVVGGFQRIDAHSAVQRGWTPQAMEILRGEQGVLRLGLDFKAHPPSTVYRVAAFREAGGFPDALGSSGDYPLILRLTHAYGVAFFPEVLGRYRVGQHQSTSFNLNGAERTLDETIRMSNLARAIGVSSSVADQLADYNTWWIFRIIAGNWFSSHPFFVSRLFRKCLLSTPSIGYWKSRVKQEYPVLFFRPRWLSILFYKTAKTILPRAMRRRLGHYTRALLA